MYISFCCTSESCLCGTSVVKELVEKCATEYEFKRKDLLHSQNFRRYMATVCQVSFSQKYHNMIFQLAPPRTLVLCLLGQISTF